MPVKSHRPTKSPPTVRKAAAHPDVTGKETLSHLLLKTIQKRRHQNLKHPLRPQNQLTRNPQPNLQRPLQKRPNHLRRQPPQQQSDANRGQSHDPGQEVRGSTTGPVSEHALLSPPCTPPSSNPPRPTVVPRDPLLLNPASGHLGRGGVRTKGGAGGRWVHS